MYTHFDIYVVIGMIANNQGLHGMFDIPVQSAPITNKVVSSNLVHGEVYSIQHYVIKFVSRWFSSGTPINHDITEILLKVALSTIN